MPATAHSAHAKDRTRSRSRAEPERTVHSMRHHRRRATDADLSAHRTRVHRAARMASRLSHTLPRPVRGSVGGTPGEPDAHHGEMRPGCGCRIQVARTIRTRDGPGAHRFGRGKGGGVVRPPRHPGKAEGRSVRRPTRYARPTPRTITVARTPADDRYHAQARTPTPRHRAAAGAAVPGRSGRGRSAHRRSEETAGTGVDRAGLRADRPAEPVAARGGPRPVRNAGRETLAP
jgi:hypothetical protein